MDAEDRLDGVRALRHDLGKYLVLPVGMLPADAGRDALRGALADALLRTRRSATGTQSAAEVWADFQAQQGDDLAPFAAYAALCAAVARALALEVALSDSTALPPRAQILRELRAVGEAIDALTEDLEATLSATPTRVRKDTAGA